MEKREKHGKTQPKPKHRTGGNTFPIWNGYLLELVTMVRQLSLYWKSTVQKITAVALTQSAKKLTF